MMLVNARISNAHEWLVTRSWTKPQKLSPERVFQYWSWDQVISLILDTDTSVVMNIKYHMDRHGLFTGRIGTLN